RGLTYTEGHSQVCVEVSLDIDLGSACARLTQDQLPGFPGFPGEKGEMGVAGRFGTLGAIGPTGPKGREGLQGSRGLCRPPNNNHCAVHENPHNLLRN
uniref:Uncharacterized protein n=1 Tax=Oncorhynchus kisutch TaxID=8019 RepID=A0A8C7KT51_ONCKI